MTELKPDSVWFYDFPEAEITLEVNGTPGNFLVRGLSSKQQEKFGSKSTPISVDDKGHVEVGEFDFSKFVDQFILESLVRAPFPITLENVERLRGPARKKLFEKAVELSDSSRITEEVKKKLST